MLHTKWYCRRDWSGIWRPAFPLVMFADSPRPHSSIAQEPIVYSAITPIISAAAGKTTCLWVMTKGICSLICFCVYTGVAALCPEHAGGERGGEKQNGGEYGTTVAVRGGYDRSHTKRPAEGDRTRRVRFPTIMK